MSFDTNNYYAFSPYLGPLLQTRNQKGAAIATLAGNKEKGPLKRLLARSTATTVVKRSDYFELLPFLLTQFSYLLSSFFCTSALDI